MQDYVKRSFLFEIVNKTTRSKIMESFALILPPESEDIEEPQRVSYTKTFGGIFVDDYGEDEKKIIISGNTGNSEAKKTFSSPGSSGRVEAKMNGQDAFFYFRNKLMRYKNKIKNYDNYEMVIYDLSLIPERYRQGNFSKLIPSITEGYVVSLDRFKMTRNKEKPLFFNYTIEMTTLRKLGEAQKSKIAPVIIEKPFNLIDSIRKGLNAIKSVYGKIVAIKNKIESYIEFVGQLEDQLVAFYDQTVDILKYPASLAKLALSQVISLRDSIESLGESAAADAGIILEEYYNSLSVIQEITQSTAALVTKAKEPDSYENSFSMRSSSSPTAISSGIKRYENLTELEAEIFDIVSEVNVSEEEVKVAYSHEISIITEETTLESLATEYYGNPSLQELIALYNNLDGVDDLTVGNVIKIPIFSPFVPDPGNLIYTLYANDVYGIDIKLDNKNNPILGESGDFLSTSDISNMSQAMDLRLNESLGTRLRLATYGIKASIGLSTSSSVAYIITNIYDTLMQDPRIKEVENILINGNGDKLSITFDTYTIKKGEVIPFKNSI